MYVINSSLRMWTVGKRRETSVTTGWTVSSPRFIPFLCLESWEFGSDAATQGGPSQALTPASEMSGDVWFNVHILGIVVA